MSRRLIAFIVFLIAVLGITVVGYSFLNSPNVVAYRTLKGAVRDFTERDEIEPLLSTSGNGSAEFEFGNIKNGNEVLFDGKVSGKFYSSSNFFTGNAFMLSDFTFKYDSLDIEGDLYISDKEIYVDESKVLNGAYGAKLDELAEDLSRSIFNPSSNSEYALDQETYDRIIAALEGLEDDNEFSKDAEKLVKNVSRDIRKIILSYAETDSEVTKERINDKEMKVRVVTFTFDDDAKQNIVRDVYDYLRKSEDIVAFLDEHEDTLVPMLENMYGIKCDASLSFEYTKWLVDAEEDVEDICDELENLDTVEIKLTTTKRKANLLKIEIAEDKDVPIYLDFGSEGVKDTDTIKLVLDEVCLTYLAKNNNSTQGKFTLTAEVAGRTLLKSVMSIDHQSDKYTLTLSGASTESYEFKITVKGSLSTEDETTTVTLDSISFMLIDGRAVNETVLNFECSVTLSENDTMPKPIKEYKSIADVTEKDVDTWLDKLLLLRLMLGSGN